MAATYMKPVKNPSSSVDTPVHNGSTLLKQRNARRDQALRKKLEVELSRRPGDKNKTITNTGNAVNAANSTTSDAKRRYGKHTVSSLRPNQALTLPSSGTVLQAAQLMAAKRTDAVLALDEHGQLAGILTDKDVAYRVVAEGLDLRTSIIRDVMTKNPTSGRLHFVLRHR